MAWTRPSTPVYSRSERRHKQSIEQSVEFIRHYRQNSEAVA